MRQESARYLFPVTGIYPEGGFANPDQIALLKLLAAGDTSAIDCGPVSTAQILNPTQPICQPNLGVYAAHSSVWAQVNANFRLGIGPAHHHHRLGKRFDTPFALILVTDLHKTEPFISQKHWQIGNP